jgi:hypothetical protein
MSPHLSAAFALILVSATSTLADPLRELASFSAFSEVDMDRLADGKIVTARGRPMKYPRGLSVQSLFVVRRPVAETADMLVNWSGVRHRQLEVFLHHVISGKPVPGEFQEIKAAPKNSSVRSLVEATRKTNPERPELHLSAEEAKQAAQPEGDISGAVGDFWTNVLQRRAAAFASGGLAAQPRYIVGGEQASPAAEVSRLLQEHPNIRRQFSDLISNSAIGGGGSPKLMYWDMFDVEGQAALALGAIYTRQGGESWQILDLQYYASSGHLALLTLYQLWPIDVGGKPATLVWRGDIVSAPALSSLKGVERLGSGTAMSKEIEKSISFFQKDANR